MRPVIALAAALLTAALAPAADPAASTVYVSRHLGNGVADAGTGTVVSSTGGCSLVLTNAHVAEDGTKPLVVTHGTTSYPAEYLAGSRVRHLDARTIAVDGPDLALLAVAAELPAAELADADPAVGSRVRVWGFAGRTAGQPPVLKVGVVAGTTGEPRPQLLTTAPTLSGDSGAGVFDDAGRLVAVGWGRRGPQYAEPLGTVLPTPQPMPAATRVVGPACPNGRCPSATPGGFRP